MSASAAGPAAAAAAAAASRARGLALRLGRLRGAEMTGSAAIAGGQRKVPASQAAAAETDAREVAAYFTQPATVELMQKNPLLIPPSLAKPMGKTRAAACKEVRLMGLSRKVGGCCSAAGPVAFTCSSWVQQTGSSGLPPPPIC